MKNNVKLGLITLTGILGAASIAAASPTTVAAPTIGSSLTEAPALPTYVAGRASSKDVVEVKKRPAPIISKRSQWFLKLDANSDGFVSYAEMQRGTPNNAKKRFERLDANGDGKLTMAEVTVKRNARGKGHFDKARPAKTAKKLDREGRAKHEAKKARRSA